MSEGAFSFVYDRRSADAAFPGIGARELVLSLLAGIPAAPDLAGCSVGLAASPLGADTVCVATQGPAGDELQLRLVEAFERQAIRVLAVYEGGPADCTKLATARAGHWASS